MPTQNPFTSRSGPSLTVPTNSAAAVQSAAAPSAQELKLRRLLDAANQARDRKSGQPGTPVNSASAPSRHPLSSSVHPPHAEVPATVAVHVPVDDDEEFYDDDYPHSEPEVASSKETPGANIPASRASLPVRPTMAQPMGSSPPRGAPQTFNRTQNPADNVFTRSAAQSQQKRAQTDPRSRPNQWVNGEKFIPAGSASSFTKDHKAWRHAQIPAGSAFSPEQWKEARDEAKDTGKRVAGVSGWIVVELQTQEEAQLLRFDVAPSSASRTTKNGSMHASPTISLLSDRQQSVLDGCLLLSPDACTEFSADISGVFTHEYRWTEEGMRLTSHTDAGNPAEQENIHYRVVRPRAHQTHLAHLFGVNCGFDHGVLDKAQVLQTATWSAHGADWSDEEALASSYHHRMR